MAFAAVCLALAVSVAFVATQEGYWSVDGGAYLISANVVQGLERLADFPRPPLAPGWLLVPFTEVLGPDAGLRAFHVFARVPLILAVWLLVRTGLPRPVALSAVVLVAFDWMLAEMFAAGALPMLGFAAMLAVMWGVWQRANGASWVYGLPITVGIPLIAYTNQTSAGISAYLLIVWTLTVGYSTCGTREIIRRVSPFSATGGLIALTALPYYLVVAPGSGLLRYPGPLLTLYSWQNHGWFMVALGIPLGVLAFRHGTGMARPLGAVLIATSLLVPLYSYDESVMNVLYRSRYLQSMFLMILIPWAAHRWLLRDWWRPYAVAFLSVMAVFLVSGYVYQLHAESVLARMVAPETERGIEWLEKQPVSGAVVTNSYSLSLYVSGLLHVPVSWAQVYDPPPLYREQHEDTICLFGWDPDCNWQEAAERLDAEYVLVDRVWPARKEEVSQVPGLGSAYAAVEGLSPWNDQSLGAIWGAPGERNPWAVTDSLPGLTPVWEDGRTVIWRVKESSVASRD